MAGLRHSCLAHSVFDIQVRLGRTSGSPRREGDDSWRQEAMDLQDKARGTRRSFFALEWSARSPNNYRDPALDTPV
jgi:hypothetical protein